MTAEAHTEHFTFFEIQNRIQIINLYTFSYLKHPETRGFWSDIGNDQFVISYEISRFEVSLVPVLGCQVSHFEESLVPLFGWQVPRFEECFFTNK